MGDCHECGVGDVLTRQCEYCKQSFCPDHQLPENHNCPGLRRAKSQGPEFRNVDFPSDDSVQTIGEIEDDEDGNEPRHGRRSYTRTERDDQQSNGVLSLALTGARAGKRYNGDCPNCGQWVTKHGTERFTTCSNCGWKAGLPFLRLVTHYPRWTKIKRSTIKWGKLGTLYVGLLLVGVLLLSGAAITGVLPVGDSGSTGVVGSDGSVVSGDREFNETRTERLVHQLINERRDEHGRPSLDYDTELGDIAESHSQDMADRGYFSHEDPDGNNFRHRYLQAGYNCQIVSEDPSEGYLSGAENIAKTYVYTDLATEGRDSYLTTERELARFLVNQWMNSTGHREVILTRGFENEGLGIVVTDDDEVYATQNFC